MGQQRAGWVAAGVCVCLAAGAGLEHARLARGVAEQTREAASPGAPRVFSPAVRTIAVTNNAAERAANEALRQRVAELEQALAARAAEREEPSEKPVEAPGEERPRKQSFTERMEQMKKENPEQYAEMQKRREEFRQTMEQRAQDRANFLTLVETQNMTEEQQANHEKLLETVARVNELMAQMGQSEGDRHSDLHREMGETMRTLGELYGSERRYLFEETARAVGYEESQVSAFADHMQTIVDNTSMMPGFGHRGGPRSAAPAVDGKPQ